MISSDPERLRLLRYAQIDSRDPDGALYVHQAALAYEPVAASDRALRAVVLAQCAWALSETWDDQSEQAEHQAEETGDAWLVYRIACTWREAQRKRLIQEHSHAFALCDGSLRKVDRIVQRLFEKTIVPTGAAMQTQQTVILPLIARHSSVTMERVSLKAHVYRQPTVHARVVPMNQSRQWVAGLCTRIAPAWRGPELVLPLQDGIRIGSTLLPYGSDQPVTALACTGQGHIISAHEHGSVWHYTNGLHASLLFQVDGVLRCMTLAAHPHEDDVLASVWSTANKEVYRLFVTSGGRVVFAHNLVSVCKEVHWSPNGQWLAFYDEDGVYMWNYESLQVEATLFASGLLGRGWRSNNADRYVVQVAEEASDYRLVWVSPTLALFQWSEGVAILEDDGRILKRIGRMQDYAPAGIASASLSPDGRLAVAFTNGEVLVDHNVRIEDVAPPSLAQLPLLHNGICVQKAVSHQTTWINAETELVLESATSGQISYGSYRGSVNVAVKRVKVQYVQIVNELHQLVSLARHANVCPLIGFCVQDDHISLVMEWLKGGCDLETYLRKAGPPLDEFHRVHIVLSIAEGLAHLHEHGIVHGDLKADNVVGDATFRQVRLIDFGFAADANLGHHDLGRRRGLHYEAYDAPIKPHHDVQVFQQHIVSPVWTHHPPAPLTLQGAPLDSIRSWLLEYRLHIAMHARVDAAMLMPTGSWKLLKNVAQCQGRLDISGLLQMYGVKEEVLGTYQCYQHNYGDTGRCIVASASPTVGQQLPRMEHFLGKPVELYGPALLFYDVSNDACTLSGPKRLLQHEQFIQLCNDHPVIPFEWVCVESMCGVCPIDSNGAACAWCLSPPHLKGVCHQWTCLTK